MLLIILISYNLKKEFIYLFKKNDGYLILKYEGV